MSSMNYRQIRTVSMNSRGQFVIPEDIRQDFGITGESTLVLIKRNDEIVLKRDSDVLDALEDEDRLWKALSRKSMKQPWDEDDDVWDKLYKESRG